MKEGQRLWSREELLLVINLYCKIPFGRMHRQNPQVIALASAIDRTPSSVAYKLVNFAHLDPKLDRKGASNVSKLDREVWGEFNNTWDTLLMASEEMWRERVQETTYEPVEKGDDPAVGEGKEVVRMVKVRANQNLFRQIVLSNYDVTCCITGIDEPSLLIASHILPWSRSEENRLNPHNGLCLNALHDRAFDRHLITIDAGTCTVYVSSKLTSSPALVQNFGVYEGAEILPAKKFAPSPEFLHRHNELFIP